MSNVYPNGCIPSGPTNPPVWTETGSQPSDVQYNNVAYRKTDRYFMLPSGGTRGKPNEEEYEGVRTWAPIPEYTPGPNAPYRYFWVHSHNTIESYAMTPYYPYEFPFSDFEPPVFQATKNSYFKFWERSGNVSEEIEVSRNNFLISPLSKSYRMVVKRNYDIGLGEPSPGGIFDIWVDSLPVVYPPFIQVGDDWVPNPRQLIPPISGWSGPPPGYDPSVSGPWPPPPDPPEITKTINETIQAAYPFQVGMTYSGYLEVMEATGQWVAIPDTNPVQYQYEISSPPTISQIAISYTVTKADYVRAIDGEPAIPNNVTRTLLGGENVFKSFGRVVLTSVTAIPD